MTKTEYELLRKKLEEYQPGDEKEASTTAVIRGSLIKRVVYGVLYKRIFKPLADRYKRKYENNLNRTFDFLEFTFVSEYFIVIKFKEIESGNVYELPLNSVEFRGHYSTHKNTKELPNFVNFKTTIKEQFKKAIIVDGKV